MKRLQETVKRITEKLLKPAKVYIPPVAEIPLPEPRKDTPLSKEFIKPEKEVSLKRKSW